MGHPLLVLLLKLAQRYRANIFMLFSAARARSISHRDVMKKRPSAISHNYPFREDDRRSRKLFQHQTFPSLNVS